METKHISWDFRIVWGSHGFPELTSVLVRKEFSNFYLLQFSFFIPTAEQPLITILINIFIACCPNCIQFHYLMCWWIAPVSQELIHWVSGNNQSQLVNKLFLCAYYVPHENQQPHGFLDIHIGPRQGFPFVGKNTGERKKKKEGRKKKAFQKQGRQESKSRLEKILQGNRPLC